LIELINKFKGAIVLTSHDPIFINECVNKIWSIENSQIKLHTGTHNEYQEIKESLSQNLLLRYEAKQKELVKIKHGIQKIKNRIQRSINTGKKAALDRSIPRMMRGGLKNMASASAGKNLNLVHSREESIRQEMLELKPLARKDQYWQISSKIKHLKGKLISSKNLIVQVNNKMLLDNVNFEISAGERLSLQGINGSGKSTLITNLLNSQSESIYRNSKMTFSVLDQNYSLIDYSKKILDNFPGNYSYQDIRKHLGNFGFDEDMIKRNPLELSGGEQAKFALSLVASRNPDLIILDEPTNNIDLETINVIIDVLNEYIGAIIVISHNGYFIEKLKIDREYRIENIELVYH
jgi:ATPase subunit of ABC transporter with duplicated ATPase domains